VADDAGGHSQQQVAEPVAVALFAGLDAGEGSQGGQVPGQQCSPHPHGVGLSMAREQVDLAGPELRFADAVFDVGTHPKSRLDVGGGVDPAPPVDRLVTMKLVAHPWSATPSRTRASWWRSMVRRRRDRASVLIWSASTRTRRIMVSVAGGQPAGA